MLSRIRAFVASLGRATADSADEIRYGAALIGTVFAMSFNAKRWRPTVREVFLRQLLFTGVRATPIVAALAVLTGMTMILEAYSWLGQAGLTEKIGSVFVVIVARELAPLFVNLILLVRSGSAIAAEFAIMNVSGEVRALEAQGIDPINYLVMPRVLAMALSGLCLTVMFTAMALVGGYWFGWVTGVSMDTFSEFIGAVFRSLQPVDAVSIAAKGILPGVLASVICMTRGMSAANSFADVPRATLRAMSQSTAALFVSTAAISFLSYA